MTLTLKRHGESFEVHDLDGADPKPVALFRERWQAIAYMRQKEK